MEQHSRQREAFPLPDGLSKPTRSALAAAGLSTLAAVADAGERAIRALHGMGPKGIRTLKEAMEVAHLAFRADPSAPQVASMEGAPARKVSPAKLTPITVRVVVQGDLPTVWQRFTTPADILQWNSASEDWHCPEAENDLRVGGRFRYRMAARDGSAAFDFEGAYTQVVPPALIAYTMDDGRAVRVIFAARGGEVTVAETFDPEGENPRDLQRQGWQAILNRFAYHCAQQAGKAEAARIP
jgi:uncharacterized protein YndB with AHSA1/START domain